MPEQRFVVEVRDPVPGERVEEASAAIAGRFAMDPARLRKLLGGRTGPVTKPVLRAKADLIARAFSDAGVAVSVRSADEADRAETPGSRPEEATPAGVEPPAAVGREATPSTLFLSSTRWVPSPHEEPDIAALAEGMPRASGEDAEAAAYADAPSPPPPAAPVNRGLGLRGYLLIGFVASLVLLVALQAINGMEAGRARGPSTVAAGMRAYNDGDFAEARRVWTPLAQQGAAQAQYMLGYMAENGQGRPWSNHDAAAWYRLAADQGYPQAQLALGRLYQRGMGVTRDAQRAAALFRAAAAEGYGPAQFQYALALFHGDGVPQDFAQALHWFRAAAQSGVAEARPYVTFAGSALSGAGAQPPGSGQAGSAEQTR